MKLTTDMFRRMTATDVAKVFNVTKRTITNWVDEGLEYIETSSCRKFDARAVLDWHVKSTTTAYKHRIEELKQQAGDKTASVNTDDDFESDEEPIFEDNLDRQRYYQAKLVKTKYKQLEKILIPRDFHEEKMMEAGDFVRSALQSIPKELSIKLAKFRDAAEIEKFLENVICDKLREMAQIAEEQPE